MPSGVQLVQASAELGGCAVLGAVKSSKLRLTSKRSSATRALQEKEDRSSRRAEEDLPLGSKQPAVRASVSRPGLGSYRSEPCSRSVGAPASAGRAERCSMATRSTATHRSSPRPPWARLSELCGTKWQQSVMASRRRLVRGAATVARGAASASQRGGLSARPRGARPPREPSVLVGFHRFAVPGWFTSSGNLAKEHSSAR